MRLTPKGLRHFARMAEAHEGWVNEILARFSGEQSHALIGSLDVADGSHTLGSATDHEEFQAQALRLAPRRRRRHHLADTAGAQEPADVRRYAELRDTFRALAAADDVKAVVIASNGGNFCSGGDVHDIIGPLLDTRHEGSARVHAHDRRSGQGDARPARSRSIAAVDGVCVGAGAMIALVADLRLGTPAAKTAFLFTRVGLAGCDMGACAMLPRVIGQGRAAELLFTGPHHVGGGRRALGLLQPARGGRMRWRARRSRWRGASPRDRALRT